MTRQVITNISIDGKEMPYFTNLVIEQFADQHHRFELQLPVGELEAPQTYSIQQSHKLIGKKITISIKHYTGAGIPCSFIGLITELSFAKSHGSISDIILTGHSPTILLDDGEHNCSYTEKSLKQIAQKIVGQYPGSLLKHKENPAFTSPLPYCVQYQESNYHFLSRLAAQFGEWFYYDGNELVFGKPGKSESRDLKVGHNLSNMKLSLKIAPLQFKTRAHYYVDHKDFEKNAKSEQVTGLDKFGTHLATQSDTVFGQAPLTETPQSIIKESELKNSVKTIKAIRASSLVVLSGESSDTGVLINNIIKVSSTLNSPSGKKEDDYGKYRVIAVKHNVDRLGKYINKFEAISADVALPIANKHITRPVCEPQAAIIKDNADPEKLGRVQVKFYWQDDPEKSPWIRIVTPHAGKEKGFYFIPEIGEEVWIAFEHNNPNKPYMLGSLYHGKAKPKSDWIDKDNNYKAIKTKGGNQIEFHDKKGKEEIKIYNTDDETNSISLLMKGNGLITIKTKGKIAMHADTITMDAKTIEMNADNITVKATQTHDLKAMDIKMAADNSTKMTSKTKLDIDGGLNTSIKSKIGLKVDGGVTTDIKSSAKMGINGGAMTEVKGILVKIN